MTDDSAASRPPIQPGERAKTIVAIEVILRIMRKALDCFPDDDLETVLVFLTVAAASTSQHLRDTAVIELMDDNPIPQHLHRPTSGRAIAEATGLRRETVRRRIDALVKAGRLNRDARGVQTVSGTLAWEENLEFARFAIQELSAASARLARFDRP